MQDKDNYYEVAKIFDEYRYALAGIELYQRGNLKRLDYLSKYYQLVDSINSIVHLVDEQATFFILNEWINKNSSFWWQQYYSRSTYYRLRNKLSKQFLKYYYNFN